MDYHLLGLGKASSLVRSFRLADWGATLFLDCVYDPLGDRLGYQLSFHGCTEFTIELMRDASVHEEFAELIGISFGRDRGRSPAIVTTDLFEFSVRYDRWQCHKTDAALAVTD